MKLVEKVSYCVKHSESLLFLTCRDMLQMKWKLSRLSMMHLSFR